MSCPNSNSPIDINIQDISGNCDLKCAYNFKYPISSCNVTNRGTYLSLKYDSFSNPPVTFNTKPYNVTEIRIYNPSLHAFSGKKTVGEIVIVHNSTKGGNPLLVCIPLIGENSSAKASMQLTTIIDTMTATKDGETESVSLNDFTLNDFVPYNPFFTYTALQPYQPCVGNVDIIVFGVAKSACKISSDTLSKLQSINSPNDYTIKTGPLLFYNATGPGSATGNDEIYIDCKPTGTSDENTTVTTQTGSSKPFTIDGILQSPAFQFIVCFILIVAIIYLLRAFINSGTAIMSGKSFELNINPFKKS